MTDGRIILGIDPGTNVLGFGIVRINARGSAEFVDMGVVDIRKVDDSYEKLRIIHDKVAQLCAEHKPDAMSIESPFYGRNAQVIFKLGRAQGAAIVAAREAGIDVFEYAPRKAKMAICGNGAASKEQVALMVEKTLGIDIRTKFLDATDALAAAYCHFIQMGVPQSGARHYGSWKDFVTKNQSRCTR